MAQLIWRRDFRSPNFNGRDNAAVSVLVMHYTGMKSAAAALSRLCEREAKVSAHYVVDLDGTIYQLVDEAHCAWHAGLSFWRGHRNVNDTSVGIEIVNPGHEWGYRGFPVAQMEAVALLSKDIISRNAIVPGNVVGHSDVAPQRKEDPGELFDWKWLAERGVGVWPEIKKIQIKMQTLKPGDRGGVVLALQASLAKYGYDIAPSSVYNEVTQKVVIAFQRHFRPENIAGEWDAQCAEILKKLLTLI